MHQRVRFGTEMLAAVFATIAHCRVLDRAYPFAFAVSAMDTIRPTDCSNHFSAVVSSGNSLNNSMMLIPLR